MDKGLSLTVIETQGGKMIVRPLPQDHVSKIFTHRCDLYITLLLLGGFSRPTIKALHHPVVTAGDMFKRPQLLLQKTVGNMLQCLELRHHPLNVHLICPPGVLDRMNIKATQQKKDNTGENNHEHGTPALCAAAFQGCASCSLLLFQPMHRLIRPADGIASHKPGYTAAWPVSRPLHTNGSSFSTGCMVTSLPPVFDCSRFFRLLHGFIHGGLLRDHHRHISTVAMTDALSERHALTLTRRYPVDKKGCALTVTVSTGLRCRR